MFTRSRPFSLSSATLIQFTPLAFHRFKIHCNIILRSKPRYFKWALSFRFPYHNSACISLLPKGLGAACPVINLILLHSLTLTVSDEQHQSWSFSSCIPTSPLLLPLSKAQIPSSAQHSRIYWNHVPPLMCETKFTTRINNRRSCISVYFSLRVLMQEKWYLKVQASVWWQCCNPQSSRTSSCFRSVCVVFVNVPGLNYSCLALTLHNIV